MLQWFTDRKRDIIIALVTALIVSVTHFPNQAVEAVVGSVYSLVSHSASGDSSSAK